MDQRLAHIMGTIGVPIDTRLDNPASMTPD